MADEPTPRLPEGVRSGVVLLDAGVVRDVATSLSGMWSPVDETDPERRAQLIGAARLRIYTAGDTHGWHLATTPNAHRIAERRSDAGWSVEFLQDVASLPESPLEPDVEALAHIFRESGIDGEASDALAWAVLSEPVIYVVSRNPRAFKHSREHDLPERLELIDPVEALALLRLAPGEEPEVAPPGDLPVAGQDWWRA